MARISGRVAVLMANGARRVLYASWLLPLPMPTLEVLTAISVTLLSEDWTAEREVLTQPDFCQF